MLKQTIANHSELDLQSFKEGSKLLKLNLQYFSDGEEDVILPDDFTPEQPDLGGDENLFGDELPPDSDELPLDDELEAEALEGDPTPEEVAQMIKVKFNHEEQEIPLDEAIPLIQKGMNYDKLQEKYGQLESDPRLTFVEEMAKEQGMDVPEFLEAVKSAREDRQLQELVQNNIPEEYAREMLENRKFREQLEQEKQQNAEEEKRNTEYTEFFDVFQQTNDRNFDPTKDQIPQEVWDAHAQGTPLKYAYMEHHARELKSQLQTFKQNEKNTKRAPVGSLTNFGGDEPTSEDLFLKGFNS